MDRNRCLPDPKCAGRGGPERDGKRRVVESVSDLLDILPCIAIGRVLTLRTISIRSILSKLGATLR